jgi:DNA-binding CsgD family transcriptional regulator
MRAVPHDDAYEEHGDLGFEPEPLNGHGRVDAVRSWLASGTHLVDPRRRFGDHGRARELLVVDRPMRRTASEGWQSLASALHRHTVQGGLSTLSPEERRVITLAYLEGHTNREIAAILGLSVTTVRRRLAIALERLDAYISRTGAWLSAIVLLGAAYAIGHAIRLGRLAAATASSADRTQRLAATVAAGTLTAAALGIAAYTSASAVPSTARHTYNAISPLLPVGALAAPGQGPHAVHPAAARPVTVALMSNTSSDSSAGHRHPNNGCGANPTSAPPAVPVGPRGSHVGPPITHPTAGGCKA